mmetsp:Transcript_5585/g.8228  ORF Transcript_5585/g.8228 Transcript_5585/m.8228 type:complete len:347 (+) Transcript_5585:75-1115(+)|eukprot:CAMPEP_0117425396 /NCGR_PEP_ID=MMETSP0758-20121206/5655_1 /TAXON_ID=63605 /ORGANISM="Percolomonas cosmopolitus, Strain AE-1 (ATCC 50343)" /LENGTH=346 /DNA_ID=CAMNT_0005209813 /DNA_START=12 /DNA_END=1052 /DNA_ORIENTATION=+
MVEVKKVDKSMLNLKDFVGYTKEDAEDFHEVRRREMLKKYGAEIKQLYGICDRTKYVVTGVALSHIAIAILATKYLSFWMCCVVCFVVGGTLAQMLTLAIHEVTHLLAFKNKYANWALAFLADCACPPFATAGSFKIYHSEHHNYQGVRGIDMDIASDLEGEYWGAMGQSKIGKFILFALNGFFYSLRPMIERPKGLTQTIIVNWIVQMIFNVALIHYFGWAPMLYLFAAMMLGMGINPISGHYISEHFVAHPSQDTYSYYGPLNILAFNVGYHVEHHDFPNIPGSRLYRLREIAPEYYNDRLYHTSWVKVIYDFIMTDGYSGLNRKKVNKDDPLLAYRDISVKKN